MIGLAVALVLDFIGAIYLTPVVPPLLLMPVMCLFGMCAGMLGVGINLCLKYKRPQGGA